MLVGRRSEIEAIDRMLADAHDGRSGVLVIRGEAGIGKSRLLGYALERAEDMAVLSGIGIESESELAFAGLHQLFRPVLDRIDGLPEPQAAALRAAFALSTETVDDRFRVAVAVLGLLCELAEERPLLCVLDDAQWLDQASIEALLFSARRLEAEPLVVLFAVREGLATTFSAPGLPELRLRNLDDVDARSLATERLAATATTETVEWLVRNAQGNPLALIELAAASVNAGAVPPTTSVEQTYRERIERLPAAARRLLVIAAAEGNGDRAVIARAAAEVGLDPGELAAAEAAGLVDVEGDVVAFRHPLVRSAAYRGAGFDERERAHRVLADVLERPADADRRAWHRAAATVGVDKEVAAELEQSAIRARQRGGPGAAAAALVRAADLSEDDAERARRLLLAAAAANLAGQYEQTVALTERAGKLELEPGMRADLAILRGNAELWHGRPAESSDRLTAAAEAVAPHDAGRALQLTGAAFMAGAIACDVARISRAGRLAAVVTPDPDDEHQVLLSLLARGGELLFRGDVAASAPFLRRATGISVGTDVPQDMVWRALAAVFSGEYTQAQELCSTAAARARELGALGTLWYVLTAQALCNLYFAYTREAAEAAHEAVQLSMDFGVEEHAASAVGVLAWAAAIQGDEEEQRRCTERVGVDAARGIALPPATIAWGRAELALARGRWEDALDDLTAVSDYRPGFGHPLLAAAAAPGLVEAAVRSGQPELAAGALALLKEWVDHGSPQHRRPLLERALALRAETAADATGHYEEALRLHEHGGSPFNRARTELLYGEHLRRERKRREARPHLRAALQGFEQLGAAPWADRASGELRATGETARKRDPSTLGQLTPQELQITRLVGEGGSNKEIAAQLFLSPRTVEYHLRKVFMKLGVASRAELIRQGVGAELAGVP